MLDKFLQKFEFRAVQKFANFKNVDEFLENLDNFLQKFEFRAVQKCANLVDLEKCCKMTTKYLAAKIGVDIAENEPRKECGVVANLREPVVAGPEYLYIRSATTCTGSSAFYRRARATALSTCRPRLSSAA